MDSNRKSVLEAWLTNLCRMLPEVQRAVIVCDFEPGHELTPAICWPDNSFDATDLCMAAKLANSRDSPVFNSQELADKTTDRTEILVAYPLNIKGETPGTVSLSLLASPMQQSVIVQLLEWGQSWLQLALSHSGTVSEYTDISVLQACLHSSEIRASANAVVTQFASKLACQRVSLGLLQGEEIRLIGISNSPAFDPRTTLIQNIEEVMEETRALETLVTYRKDQPVEATSNSAHWRLAETQGSDHICSIPMRDGYQIIGVLVLERNLKAFSADSPGIDLSLLDLLGKVLLLQQQSALGTLARFKHQLGSLAVLFLGSGAIRLKLGTIGLLAASLFVMQVPGEFRVSSDAVLEGRVQRAIVAPFDGYVSTASARAGDLVQKDDVIAELDGTDLRLERQRWLRQRDEYNQQYRNALAVLDHTAANISQSQLAQADAQLELIAGQLRRVKLVAPLDGIIISGDLSRLLGIPLERGQLLFEIAPLDEYRLILNVDEQDIVYVHQGQTGTLTLAAFPRREIPFVVQNVAVLHQQNETAITYRTEASLDSAVADLRPGMQGVGKIYIDDRNYLWIWFHKMADWMRLKMWAWLP
jgi:multidrug resistance efflux pump